MEKQLNELKNQITDLQKKRASDGSLLDIGKDLVDEARKVVTRKALKGHFGKVYSCHWAGNNTHLVSASQDGKLIIWNARTTNKIQAISLRSSYVMGVAIEQKTNGLVVSGGLDNLVTIHKINLDGQAPSHPDKEFNSHDGYVSSVRFVDSDKVLSASGDSSIKLWDVERGTCITTYEAHEGDVMSVATCESSPDLFAGGSCDASVSLFDVREYKCVQMFRRCHESDVNSVCFHPSGTAIISGGDDSSIKLWSLRSSSEMNNYASDRILCGITSVEVTKSGAFIFGGYDDYQVQCWQTLKGGPGRTPLHTLSSHENRVACLNVSKDGQALASGSWDSTLKVFA